METIILVGIEFNKKQTSKRMSQFFIYVHLSVRFAVWKISVDDSQAYHFL